MGRIVITGGAGFIGSHLAERLRGEGHEIVVFDNLITGSRDNIAALADDPGFTFHEQDVSEPFFVDGDVDAIYHLASPASPHDFARVPIQIMKVGSLGTYHALGMAKAKGCPILVASTSEVYGDPLQHPQQETYWGNVNPIGPRSCYDEAKRFTEAITMSYHRYHGVQTRIVRIFNTYGPRMGLADGRVLPNFLTQALRGEALTVYGDGSQTRSFCFVDDLVDGIVRLMNSGENFPVNIGNPIETTIAEFARTMIEATGSSSELTFKPLPENDPKRRRPDITRAREILGWEPRVTLDDGLRRTIADFRVRLGLDQDS